MIQKNVLGKGLGALLTGSSNKTEASYIQDIPISQISVNPFQPRKNFDPEALESLSESIRIHGIIQPLTLRKVSDCKYELISGERRLQASILANLTHIPGYIRVANDTQMLEMALVENVQRENLNPIEIALSYQRLINECNTSQQSLATRLGKDRTTISNYIRLLKLPPEIQVALRDGILSMGHARAIIGIESVDLQLQIFKETIDKDLSVRGVEERVRALNSVKVENNSKKVLPQFLYVMAQKVSEQLSTDLQAKVKVFTNSSGKGEIKIKFSDREELERLSILLQKEKND
jgi:ParB family chromosome partitioning protein